MRAVGILCSLMLGSGPAGATSLAVIRTAPGVVIAADRRVTSLTSENSMPEMCKVRQTGNAIAAFVGLVSYSTGSSATSFDAVGMVDAILDEGGTLAAKAEKVKVTLGSCRSKVVMS